jgi:hypothetical protein
MIFDFITYMQSIAENLLALGHSATTKHFFRVSGISGLEEILQNLSTAEFPALCVVDNPEGRMASDNRAGVIDRQYYYFFVIKPSKTEDADSRHEAIADSLTISKQIVSKILNDYMNENRVFGNATGLMRLQTDSFSYKSVGPLGDNCHGVWISFAVINESGIRYDTSQWKPAITS